MKLVFWTIVVILMVAAAGMWKPMTWQESSSGNYYYVKRAPGQREVADRLDSLTGKLQTLLDKADDLYPGDRRIANVQARWSGTLAEVSGAQEIAYSMNKRDIYVCIRDPKDDSIEPPNTSMYVLLHEIAHVATDVYGHPPEFWINFRWFLEVAESLGIYVYEDFDTKQTTFCGHTLGNNVLRCVKKNTCRSLLPN
jgi:hypothetical protein